MCIFLLQTLKPGYGPEKNAQEATWAVATQNTCCDFFQVYAIYSMSRTQHHQHGHANACIMSDLT